MPVGTRDQASMKGSNSFIHRMATLRITYKVLLPVCMKCTAEGESSVANIAQTKPIATFVTRLSPRAVYFT